MALHEQFFIPQKEVVVGMPVKITSVDFSNPDLPGLDFDLSPINQLMVNAMKEISRKREIKIIEALKNKGFQFDTMEALEQFAKERCTLERYDEKPTERWLWVDYESNDRVLICMWDEAINTNITTTITGSKMTITQG